VNPLNRPNDYVPPLPGDGPDARDEGNLDLLATLSRRKWIVVCSVIVAMVMAVLYLARTKPTYESSATVLLKFSAVDNALGAGQGGGRGHDEVPDHMRIVHSPLILEPAAAQLSKANLPGLPQKGDTIGLAQALGANLTTSRDEKSKMFTIAYRCSDPATSQRVASAIAESYEVWVRETQQGSAKKGLDALVDDRRRWKEELKETERQYYAFQMKHKMLVLPGQDGKPAILDRVRMLYDTLVEAGVRRREAEEFHSHVIYAVEKKQPLDSFLAGTDLSQALSSGRAATPMNLNREAQIMLLNLQVERLSKRLGRGHPKMRELLDQLAVLQAPRMSDGRDATEDSASQQACSDLLADWLVRTATGRVEQFRAVEEQLSRDFKREREEALQLHNKYKQLTMLSDNMDRLNRDLIEVEDQIKALSKSVYGSRVPLSVAQVEKPKVPMVPVSPNIPRTIVLALVAGLVVGFSLVWLTETFDRSFRSPDDVRAILSLPVLGNVPLMDRHRGEERTRGDIWLTTVDSPHSRETEAFRALRTVVGVAATAKQFKSLLFTSPAAGDGKTTVASNMAVAAAQLGARVLLIDADMRQPSVHHVFGCSNKRGLSTFLENKATQWRHEIDPVEEIANLHVLPAGPVTHQPAELLGSERFRLLVEEAKAEYDYVICDSPPVMPVTDPCIVAGVADAVILVVKASRNERSAAQAAKAALDGVGAELLGVVMNDVSAKTKYGYTYYRRQQYGDGYQRGYGVGQQVHSDGDNGDAVAPQPVESSRTEPVG